MKKREMKNERKKNEEQTLRREEAEGLFAGSIWRQRLRKFFMC